MTASPPPVSSTSTSRQETLSTGRSHTVVAPPICPPITTLLPDAPRAFAAGRSFSGGDGNARKKTIARRPEGGGGGTQALELVVVCCRRDGRGDRQPGSREEARGGGPPCAAVCFPNSGHAYAARTPSGTSPTALEDAPNRMKGGRGVVTGGTASRLRHVLPSV